jgi:hypothetical protein
MDSHIVITWERIGGASVLKEQVVRSQVCRTGDCTANTGIWSVNACTSRNGHDVSPQSAGVIDGRSAGRFTAGWLAADTDTTHRRGFPGRPLARASV